MKKTLVDFWRLVWQERSQVVVMVTNFKEESKSKCEQYWPQSPMDTTKLDFSLLQRWMI